MKWEHKMYLENFNTDCKRIMISTPEIYDTHKEAHDNKIFETNIFKNLNAIRGERLYIGWSQNERLLTSFQKNISNKVMNDILMGKKLNESI